MKQADKIINTVVTYYNQYNEQTRLSNHWGQVEFLRTQTIIKHYLKHPPAVILDVGGAAGRYACWLAQAGYEVHLIDPVPLHVQQAQTASEAQPGTPIASCSVGDARLLTFDTSVADAVLLLGPLYHLVAAQDRAQALSEAYRVLKRGGYVFAAGISRFASTIDGLDTGHFLDPTFQKIMQGDLKNGQHRNPTDNPAYFTDTFFHHPDELRAEVAGAGFEIAGLLAIEGISYMMKDFDKNWEVESHRKLMLEIIGSIEREPSLLGASPHIMCVGTKV
ncbi:MAG: class I SAM-dependent methyltransferase [Anaerolineae bacterium]|nr:class I SAM-dependent methyltransferase [Anaerolineae bacterium]